MELSDEDRDIQHGYLTLYSDKGNQSIKPSGKAAEGEHDSMNNMAATNSVQDSGYTGLVSEPAVRYVAPNLTKGAEVRRLPNPPTVGQDQDDNQSTYNYIDDDDIKDKQNKGRGPTSGTKPSTSNTTRVKAGGSKPSASKPRPAKTGTKPSASNARRGRSGSKPSPSTTHSTGKSESKQCQRPKVWVWVLINIVVVLVIVLAVMGYFLGTRNKAPTAAEIIEQGATNMRTGETGGGNQDTKLPEVTTNTMDNPERQVTQQKRTTISSTSETPEVMTIKSMENEEPHVTQKISATTRRTTTIKSRTETRTQGYYDPRLPEAEFKMVFNITKGNIYNICFLNENTLVAALYSPNQLSRYKINLQDSTNEEISVLDAGYSPVSISCPTPNTLYAVDSTNKRIRIYEGMTKSFWEPSEINKNYLAQCKISANYKSIALVRTSTAYIYRKSNKTTPYTRSLPFSTNYIVLTPGEHLVASSNDGAYAMFLDLNQPESEAEVRGGSGSGEGLFDTAGAVAVLSGGRILVADTNNHRIHVYTKTGQFLGYVKARDGTIWEPVAIAVYNAAQYSIMAVQMGKRRYSSKYQVGIFTI